MSQLTLKLRCPPPGLHRVNLYGLTPARLRRLTLAEIAQVAIPIDGQPQPLGDWFEIRDGDRDQLCLEGDLSRCDFLGGGLDGGSIEVLGGAGDRLAESMTGGQLLVRGDVGQWASSGQRGGLVRIQGSAGAYLGGAVAGRKHGMRGGTLVVCGDVGPWAAARMRRGTIVIHGQVEVGLGMRMIAGSVVCCGQVHPHWGCGMQRGTLLNLRQPIDPIPAFGFSAAEYL